MPALTQDTIELIVGNCESRLADLAESLSRELGVPTQLEFGSSDGWPPAESEAEWAGPGLIVTIEVEGVGLTAIIPASLPLPNWIHAPTDSEQSQLETLAMEWSLHLLPDDAEASAFHARGVTELAAALEELAPDEWAASALLWARPAAADLLEPPVPIRLIWPVTKPKFKPAPASPAPVAQSSKGPASGGAHASPSGGPPAQPPRPAFAGLARLRYLPVSVSVRVAEKKIALSQVLAITPGTLVTFTKSCEEPLDLYVNNQLYGHGEAVKIGENFGLKINTIGTTTTRVQKIVND